MLAYHDGGAIVIFDRLATLRPIGQRSVAGLRRQADRKPKLSYTEGAFAAGAARTWDFSPTSAGKNNPSISASTSILSCTFLPIHNIGVATEPNSKLQQEKSNVERTP